MRPKTILLTAAVLALTLGVATSYKLSRSAPAEVPPRGNAEVVGPGPVSVAPGSSTSQTAQSAPADPKAGLIAVVPTPSSTLNHSNYVATRTAELMDLSMENDNGSLQTILSELNNRDPVIRAAALEAAIQFSSRDAIPALLDAANQTEDPREKQALIEAAEFLKLPSLTELRAAGGIKPVTVKVKPLRRMSQPEPPLPKAAQSSGLRP